jgi:hypothetical protein
MSQMKALNTWPNLILSCKKQMFPVYLPADEIMTYGLKFHGGYILLKVSTIRKMQVVKQGLSLPKPVLRIRISMFFGLLDPDPDPLVRGTDPDPSIIKQKQKQTLIPITSF